MGGWETQEGVEEVGQAGRRGLRVWVTGGWETQAGPERR